MLLKQVIEIYDYADRSDASGKLMKSLFDSYGCTHFDIEVIQGEGGSTDFVKVVIPGTDGKLSGGKSPTLGIIGRLGGIGARPNPIGYVSDGDGAVAALTAALKLVDMSNKGDRLKGDVIVTTHICPDAPTEDHFPVPFMGSPVDMEVMNRLEVINDMDAILTIDTTKGNETINNNGIAISPTVKQGYILPVSYDLLSIMKTVTGKLPNVFALSIQDITPYSNGLWHINSILQPSVATEAPVVGVAITTETPIAGCATGASHFVDIELAARYAVEVAKSYTAMRCEFYDEDNFNSLINLYGDNKRYQTPGIK